MKVFNDDQWEELQRIDRSKDITFKTLIVYTLALTGMLAWFGHNETESRKRFQSECIRLGYGEYVDGVFVLKNADTHTD